MSFAFRGIYALVDPRNDAPFYVGQSTNAWHRYGNHIVDSARYLSRPKHATGRHLYIVDLITHDLLPRLQMLEVIEEMKSDQHAIQDVELTYMLLREINLRKLIERERFWIQHLTEQGYVLTNLNEQLRSSTHGA